MSHGRTPSSGEVISYLVLSVELCLVGLWVAVGDVVAEAEVKG